MVQRGVDVDRDAHDPGLETGHVSRAGSRILIGIVRP
jgi:hypothetical protein